MAARTQSTAFSANSVGGPSTTFTLPGSGNISSIAAGDLVRFIFRYEGGAAVTLSATDSAGASYTVVQDTGLDSPSVAVLYKHNHPGGTNVTITVTLSAGRTYLEGYGEVVSGQVGENDPITGTYGTDTDSAGPMSCTVTGVSGDCDAFMAVGSYSSSTYDVASGSTLVGTLTPSYYAAAFKQHYTGTGNKTITHTGGSGQTRGIAVGFLDDAGTSGGTNTTLDVDHGTLTITGQTLTFNLSSEVSNGLLTFVGQDVDFELVQPGVYSVDIEPGVITFSAPESYSDIGVILEPGVISFNGQDVDGTNTEPTNYSVDIDFGLITFSGKSVGLIWSGAPTGSGGRIQTGIGIGVGIGF